MGTCSSRTEAKNVKTQETKEKTTKSIKGKEDGKENIKIKDTDKVISETANGGVSEDQNKSEVKGNSQDKGTDKEEGRYTFCAFIIFHATLMA